MQNNDVVQVAQVTSGHSRVAYRFCYLAMSALIHEMRSIQHAFDQYTIIENDQGHVTYIHTTRP